MTEPHVASDDLAINAAQAGVWDALTAQARKLFEQACANPSVYALEAVGRILTTMHHHHYARLSEAGKITMSEPARQAPCNPHVLIHHVSEKGRIG